MAKIVLGIGSSHGPQLTLPPEQWRAFGDRSRTNPEHWFEGETYTFEELLDKRAADHFANESTDEKFSLRYDACQKALLHLRETLARVKPDRCIILGDDEHEAFIDDNMPAIAIYNGASVDDAPSTGMGNLFMGNAPTERVSHPTDADLGLYLIETFIANEFDVARTNAMPEGRHNGTVGHAFQHVYRRLMDNKAITSVPIMVNTYFPPNVPTALRCYKFGKVLRQAIEAWDEDKTVAIIASGGLSHAVIEEELDRRILDGLMNDDVEKLTDYSDLRFRGGTSEIKNWIALGGAMSGTSLEPQIVDYIPCYRTEAGNGCAMGMAEWT